MDVIREQVLDALDELADERQQRQLWFSTGAGGADVSSLVECRCRLFDDSNLGMALDRDQVVFDEPIDRELRSLRAALRRIDDARPPDEIVDDPALKDVRTRAADVLRSLRELT